MEFSELPVMVRVIILQLPITTSYLAWCLPLADPPVLDTFTVIVSVDWLLRISTICAILTFSVTLYDV